MNLDKKEAHYLDQFPTSYHMKTGRNTNLQLYCKHVPIGLHRQLERMKFDITKRTHPVSHRSHPKMKKFGEIDKKNLYDI